MRKNDVMRWAFLALTTHRLLIENTQIKKAMRSRFFYLDHYKSCVMFWKIAENTHEKKSSRRTLKMVSGIMIELCSSIDLWKAIVGILSTFCLCKRRLLNYSIGKIKKYKKKWKKLNDAKHSTHAAYQTVHFQCSVRLNAFRYSVFCCCFLIASS